MDVKLLGLMPHMHVRGKSFLYEAVYPDGRQQTLLDVPAYDFNWQTSYRLSEPVNLPANTRIHCVAHFDNSENNLNNPDPTRAVSWGEQTWDEMMIGYVDIAIPREAIESRLPKANLKKAQKLFQSFDRNSDGKVARDEITKRWSLLFDRLDTDKDGFVTTGELQNFKR